MKLCCFTIYHCVLSRFSETGGDKAAGLNEYIDTSLYIFT